MLEVDGDEMIEEVVKKVDPRGKFNFLNLDEVDPYRDFVLQRDFSNLTPAENFKVKEKNSEVKGMIIPKNIWSPVLLRNM